MKRRTDTRGRTAAAHYAACTLPEDFRGEHHLRIPSPLQAQKLYDAAKQGTATSDGYRLWGAAVGLAWHHDNWDLEAVNNGDVLAFGEAVYEELFEAGYRNEWICLLADVVTVEVEEATKVGAEVAKRLRFFGRTKAEIVSSNSSPPAMPMETSTGSTT